MAAEEFTFPIASPTYSPIDSPPLWRLSPSASPTPSYEDESRQGLSFFEYDIFSPNSRKQTQDINHIVRARKSCSYIERSLLKRLNMPGSDTEDEHEEKMDMLWEDLNDESSKNHLESRLIELRNCSRGSNGNKEMVEFGCVPASMKLVKSNTIKGARNVVKRNKKPSVVVLMKVIKKLFLLHHSQQSANKRP